MKALSASTFLFLLQFVPAYSVEPTCTTTFMGGMSYNANAWKDSQNWTNGIPTAGQVACIPDQLRGKIEVPGGASIRYISTDGSVAGEDLGACCVESNCINTTPANCDIQSGYFVPGVTSCFPTTCHTGACCDGQANCVDKNAFNQPMTLTDCNAQNGTYQGGAHCSQGDPCGFQQIPPGFEIVDIATPEIQGSENYWPKINNCGEVVFHTRFELFNNATQEVFLYDNGKLARLTNNNTSDFNPDINDDGTISWGIASGTDPTGEDNQVQIVRGASTTIMGWGGDFRLNNLGQGSWNLVTDPFSCEFRGQIHYYDGETTRILYEDELSNQGAELNDFADIAWTNTVFQCECCDWTSNILMYSGDQTLELPVSFNQSQLDSVDNIVRVAWQADTIEPFEIYQDGVTQPVTLGRAPALNDRGDISYAYLPQPSPYQMFLILQGTTYRLTRTHFKTGVGL